jgi:hypothetical protein
MGALAHVYIDFTLVGVILVREQVGLVYCWFLEDRGIRDLESDCTEVLW